MQGKCIHKTIFLPYLISQYIVKEFQCLHGFGRGIGKRRQCSGGRDHSVVIVWIVHFVTTDIVTGSKAPAGIAVSIMAARIDNAVIIIDERMISILVPIIGMRVGKTVGIDTQ